MKEIIRDDISTNIDENLTYLKDLFKGNSDIIFRKFNFGKWSAALVYIDGMADKALLDDFTMEPLMGSGDSIKDVKEFKDNILAMTDLTEIKKLSDGINAALGGDTLMLVSGLNVAYTLASRSWPARGTGEPSGETVVRGSRDGFVETIRFNTALVRRRIRDTRLKVEAVRIGVRSKTDVAILYIDDIVNKEVYKEVMSRIKDINIDAILDSAYVEQLIEDDKWSLFPQIQSTERPDVVSAALYEGKIAIMVDNSPFVLIVPATLPTFFQTPDDYYTKWMVASILRLLRFISSIFSILLPSLYIAITSFHTSIVPTRLAYAMAASREGVPFPAYVEVIIMEISLALLIEAIIRLPKPIGSTIGLVGGLIIGQAAVSAGIVSLLMLIIIALTTITTYMTPNYEMTLCIRVLRISLIIAATIAGLFGIVIGMLLILMHLIRLKSFGISYLAPIVNSNSWDYKDLFTRLPIQWLKKRPHYMGTGDRIRQK